MQILEFDLKTIGDPRIEYDILQCIEPSHISPAAGVGFSILKHTTMQLHPDSVIAPGKFEFSVMDLIFFNKNIYNKGIMPGATDSNYYRYLTKNIYKYLPIRIQNTELKRLAT